MQGDTVISAATESDGATLHHRLTRESDGAVLAEATTGWEGYARPRRYVGLRFLKPQGELFDDGNDRKHFAVVTNRTEDGAKVVEWHREKADTVEHVHDEMKNELTAGRLPSQKFGANAAWFALNAIAYNVAAALRAAEPEPEARVARVRTVRYHLLQLGARLSRFSRKVTLRFAASRERIARIRSVLEAFPCRVQPTG